jgi:hypothetical protein
VGCILRLTLWRLVESQNATDWRWFSKEKVMKWTTGTKNWGMLLLAIWLIAQGLLAFINIPIANIGAILAALAIATGVLLLMGR